MGYMSNRRQLVIETRMGSQRGYEEHVVSWRGERKALYCDDTVQTSRKVCSRCDRSETKRDRNPFIQGIVSRLFVFSFDFSDNRSTTQPNFYHNQHYRDSSVSGCRRNGGIRSSGSESSRSNGNDCSGEPEHRPLSSSPLDRHRTTTVLLPTGKK